MGQERIGTCSICGGDVIGTRGAYWSVVPPGPDTCGSCGAIAKGSNDVIEMEPRGHRRIGRNITWAGVRVIQDDTLPKHTLEIWKDDGHVLTVTNVGDPIG